MKRLEYRCPWCGELLRDPSKKGKSKIYFKQFDPYAIKCNYCDHMSTRIATGAPILLLLVGILVQIVSPIPEIAWIPFAIVTYLTVYRMSYERKSSGRWYQHLPKDISIGTGYVNWYSCKDGGIGLPRLRIPNYFIFPICFIDLDNQPISPMICMRFTKKEWWKLGRRYDIDSIVEDNMKYLRNDFQKFIIYSGRQPIGEGNIKLELHKNN